VVVYHACIAVVGLLVNINMQSKFEVLSSTHSKDVMGTKNFLIGHVTLTTPLPYARTCYDQPTYKL